MPNGGVIADEYLAGRHAIGSASMGISEHVANTIINKHERRRACLGGYGIEYIIDLYGCDARQFTAPAIKMFMRRLCDLLHLTPERLHIWGYDDPKAKAAAPPHLKGTSAVQFITTSNITLHCLDDLGLACVNVFTCGRFAHCDLAAAREFCKTWFHARGFQEHLLNRG